MPVSQVGTVRELRRYPVKSMAAESLSRSSASWNGLAGDRRWAFIRPGMERSGFPWLTIREKPDLWLYEPWFVDPADAEGSATMVRTPDGEELDIADAALARRLGEGIRVIKQSRGVFDTMPLSVLTSQSVDWLSAVVGQALEPLRFRPNILIDASGSGSFPEARWVGATLRIGTLRCRIDKPDKRCVVVNIDPTGSTAANPGVLRAIAKEGNACFGVYGSTIEPGAVSVGDPIFLEE
jgi:uncharacterized protein